MDQCISGERGREGRSREAEAAPQCSSPPRQGAKGAAFIPSTADLSKDWTTLLLVRHSPLFAVTRARTAYVLFLNYVLAEALALRSRIACLPGKIPGLAA